MMMRRRDWLMLLRGGGEGRVRLRRPSRKVGAVVSFFSQVQFLLIDFFLLTAESRRLNKRR